MTAPDSSADGAARPRDPRTAPAAVADTGVRADPPTPAGGDGGIGDPLTDAGGAELRRRIARATPRRVDRADLDGHVGLSSRELYELGATVAPIGLRGVPSAVGGRVLVVASAVLGTLLLAVAASVLLDPLVGAILGDDVRRDTVDRSTGAALGLAAFCGLPGLGLVRLQRWGVRRIRAGLDDRRRAIVDRSTPAADDPEARATVAVVREPGVLRVSLLWVRGDAEDAALVELRTLDETRVPDDEPGRAEDAVARYAETALRADARHRMGRTDRAGGSGGGPVGDSAPRAPADAGGRADRALVRAARSALPQVDPRQPVGPDWAPEPLTDAGRAEIAARLVRARPLLWNAGVLEGLTVDARAGRSHVPRPWPTPHGRRKALPSRLPGGRRALIGWVGWIAFLVCVVALGGSDRADAPETTRAVGYAAALVAAVVGGNVWWWRRRGPGRRLLRSVRAAARVPGRGLERGVPGPGGRVLVLHGRRDDRDRIELVHARAVPGEERGRLQVRTLAWRELPRDAVEEGREVAQRFWVVADDAGFLTGRAERDAGTVRRINAALGRVVARRRNPEVAREPLVWAAVPLGLLTVLLGVAWLVVGRDEPDGLALELALVVWPLAAAVVLWRAAARVHDPVGE